MRIKRTLEGHLNEISQNFKVLLLTGPRQVGKTTLLKQLGSDDRHYICFDDIDTRFAAKKDPAGFINSLPLPILIDEVQYVPELFPYIKLRVDKSDKCGLFWLTGSQQFNMMKNISESLAGRVAILELQGISLSEEQNRAKTPAFIPTNECLEQRKAACKILTKKEIYQKIWRGHYPHLVLDNGKTWHRFYESYITTYLERDVRDYLKVDNLMLFRKFIQVAAARTGQILNYREISKDVGASEPTIKSWFNVLKATGLIIFIQPYFNNIAKRLIKTPKFHFMDTGLCCFLTKWINPEVVEQGAMAGALLESWVVSEIIKSYIHHGRSANLYYYADKEKREIDLLIEESGKIHPIEIKKSASIHYSNFKGFDYLQNLKIEVGDGCVLCFRDSLIPFNRKINLVPVSYL